MTPSRMERTMSLDVERARAVVAELDAGLKELRNLRRKIDEIGDLVAQT